MGKMTVSQQIKIFLFKNVPSSDGVIQCQAWLIKVELESELRDHSEKDKPEPLILMYIYLEL